MSIGIINLNPFSVIGEIITENNRKFLINIRIMLFLFKPPNENIITLQSTDLIRKVDITECGCLILSDDSELVNLYRNSISQIIKPELNSIKII